MLVSLTLGYEQLILHPALFIIHRKVYIFQIKGTCKLYKWYTAVGSVQQTV